jgi:hypothetical protein
MRICLLKRSCVRSPAPSDERDNNVKVEAQDDTSLQSPMQSDGSSPVELEFCVFFLILR